MKPIRKDEIEYLSNYIDKKFKSRRSALESEREFEVDRTTEKNLPAFKSKLNVEKLLKNVVQLEKNVYACSTKERRDYNSPAICSRHGWSDTNTNVFSLDIYRRLIKKESSSFK